jgi:tetratricopeptide (TPR) repeat protein
MPRRLLGSGVRPDSEIQLLRARILIDDANANDEEALNDALEILNAQGGNLASEEQALANQYRAQARFLLRDMSEALRDINRALDEAESGSRRFLRAQILEALEEPEQAIRDYEWIITWSEIYPYPFLPDARSRLRALQTAS